MRIVSNANAAMNLTFLCAVGAEGLPDEIEVGMNALVVIADTAEEVDRILKSHNREGMLRSEQETQS